MSKAGQYTFTGISDQADIALFYLLQASKRSDFQKAIIEGNEWEDFTLVFNNYSEDYEIKSYKKPLSFNNLRKIILKENNKQYGEKDKFKIIVRKLSEEFRCCYSYIHSYQHYIKYLTIKELKKDRVVKKFLKKKWSLKEIFVLSKTEVTEFDNIKNIHNQIYEHFAFKDHFYLDQQDIEYLGEHFFKRIMTEGKKGGSIEKNQFINELEKIKKHIADKSESFPPESKKYQLLKRIKPFLKSEDEFRKLEHHRFLSPVSYNPFLIFYITDELNKNNFKFNHLDFFFEKILLKHRYIGESLKLMENKYKNKLAKEEDVIDFIVTNYDKFLYDFNYDDALRLLIDIVQKDIVGQFDEKIITFLEKEILVEPFSRDRKPRYQKKRRGWREDEQVAEMLKTFLERTKNKEDSLDFIFKYYDFTNDDSEIMETPHLVYSFVKDFIKDDLEKNFTYVIKNISKQFNIRYDGQYRGYEWSGSGFSQRGDEYSITDKGVVRFLFKPLFREYYQRDIKESWQFFKTKILDKKVITKDNPVYLKRALVPIILDRLEGSSLNEKDKQESCQYLENILLIKKGIPNTSEIIFDELRKRNLGKNGFDIVMNLIKADSDKYKSGYPTNLFVLDTLFGLIKNDYTPAKEFFISLLGKPGFIEYDRWYNSFELLVSQDIAESDPDFIVKIFNTLNFEQYLDGLESGVEYKSGILAGLIKKDWQDKTDRGKKIIDWFLKAKIPSKNVLQFLAGPIMDLAQTDAIKTYELFKLYLENKDVFKATFQNNPYIRQNIVWLAIELVGKEHYKEAKKIVELCIDDPDPQTHNYNEDFNYHLEVKQGKEQIIITTVRGKVAWVLQKFVTSGEPELMEYALKNTEILLDLDGSLAKKLGYSEPDLYVRLQALVPLIELAAFARRKKLNEYKTGLGDRVTKIAFDVIDITDRQYKQKEAEPKALLKHLVTLFSYIRDLTTEEAKRILNFFEAYQETEASFLFIYFAEFSKNVDSAYFKENLERLCKKDSTFRKSFSWEYWRIANDDEEKNTRNFDKIEKYWESLLSIYEKNVFEDFYRTLEITLTWNDKFEEHKRLLMETLGKEIEYYKVKNESVYLHEPGKEIFEILKVKGNDDFLQVFNSLVKNLNDNIPYFWMKDWVEIFRSIKPSTEEQKDKYNETESKLKEIWPY